MFASSLPASVFEMQREFIRSMDGKKDFHWWATTLVTEETKELKEEFAKDKSDMAQIFKELGDVIYVVAGFYNTLPNYGSELLSDDQNQEVVAAMEEAAQVVTDVCKNLKIPMPLAVHAFEIVHESNMSKLDENGKPIRREDGKILKGPNYTPPSMDDVVKAWSTFRLKEASKGLNNANESN